MAKAAGQIESSDIGYEVNGTYGDTMPAFHHFLLFVPLQPIEFAILKSNDVLQRFALYRRISIGSSTKLITKFSIGNFLSFYNSDTGIILPADYQTKTYQASYIYGKQAFRKLQVPPVKTLPVYVDAFMTCQTFVNSGSTKIFNIDFEGVHDIDTWVGYDDKAIRHDMSTQDLIDYNCPLSSFLIRDVLIRSYNVLMHSATANYSYILFGSA